MLIKWKFWKYFRKCSINFRDIWKLFVLQVHNKVVRKFRIIKIFKVFDIFCGSFLKYALKKVGVIMCCFNRTCATKTFWSISQLTQVTKVIRFFIAKVSLAEVQPIPPQLCKVERFAKKVNSFSRVILLQSSPSYMFLGVLHMLLTWIW